MAKLDPGQAEVFGDFHDDPAPAPHPRLRTLYGVIATMAVLLAVSVCGCVMLATQQEERLASLALLRYRMSHQEMMAWPSYPTEFDVHGERILSDFCREHNALIIVNQEGPMVALTLTYSGLLGRRSVTASSPKPSGKNKAGRPVSPGQSMFKPVVD